MSSSIFVMNSNIINMNHDFVQLTSSRLASGRRSI